MHARLALITTVALLLGLLLVLNAASYVYKSESAVDSEFSPNRSSYHDGQTGTRGLYEFLQASDYRVMRWRQSLVSLLDTGASRPQVLLIVGETRLPVTGQEVGALARWVGEGGRLIVASREPPEELRQLLAGWRITARTLIIPDFTLGEDQPDAAVQGVAQLAPAQPTVLTRGVDAMMPSRYAARLTLVAVDDEEETDGADAEAADEWPATETPPPAPAPDENDEEVPPSTAPVAHFSDAQGALLVDYVYGQGRVVLLGDPFVMANNGIGRADNLRLVLNLIGGREGLVAFDEYHHGHGAGHETLLTYFAGTPVLAMAAQLLLLALIFAWARGRRFARPLPAPRLDRRSKLEFITSMAELQMRARAFDLALENIYARTRRALVRASGAEASAPREEIAARAAAQDGRFNKEKLENLMRECEDAIAGAPLGGHRALTLTAELRRVERNLSGRMKDEG